MRIILAIALLALAGCSMNQKGSNDVLHTGIRQCGIDDCGKKP